MLTRLQVDGFKNLRDLDLRFGPFTCIAGPNGVGKSNIFDAITFLSRLASQPLMQAAADTQRRSADGDQYSDVGELFSKTPTPSDIIDLTAEMIIPRSATDDLGQPAEASNTWLRYELRLMRAEAESGVTTLRVVHESLERLKRGDKAKIFQFEWSAEWLESVTHGARTTPMYISTRANGDGDTIVSLHQDSGTAGRPSEYPAARLPRTVLSSASASESPTVYLARREMQSWTQLHLEPSALRMPDSFTDPPYIKPSGRHVPATLNRLKRHPMFADEEHALGQVSLRLAQLIDEIKSVRVDRDDVRRSFSVVASGWDGNEYSAHAMSDGTLRFLALSIMEQDPELSGTICLEEPENGIHPARIPAMLRLLKDVAVDPLLPVDQDNPMRQVIVNTHSPAFVRDVPMEDVVLVRSVNGRVSTFAAVGSWRCTKSGAPAISDGFVLDYLNDPAAYAEETGYTRFMDGYQYLLAMEEPDES